MKEEEPKGALQLPEDVMAQRAASMGAGSEVGALELPTIDSKTLNMSAAAPEDIEGSMDVSANDYTMIGGKKKKRKKKKKKKGLEGASDPPLEPIKEEEQVQASEPLKEEELPPVAAAPLESSPLPRISPGHSPY